MLRVLYKKQIISEHLTWITEVILIYYGYDVKDKYSGKISLETMVTLDNGVDYYYKFNNNNKAVSSNCLELITWIFYRYWDFYYK